MHAEYHTGAHGPEPSRVRARALRRRRRRRVTRAAAVLGLELVAAYAIFSLISVAPSEAPASEAPAGPTADEVATEPAQFRSQPVTVSGRIVDRPTRLPDGAIAAFVLGGDRGGRILVLRNKRTRGFAFKIGTTVRVSGDVVIPPDSARLAKRPASRTAIAKRMRTPALIKATRVQAVGRSAATR